ncbi:DUF3800 domain-containing protein [Streptococcus sp. NLN64]|uniref:DUF3800 domain-containing protein n=2 Tax=Streptococcus sp. NLN64 TaxID=2822799 RepID=UPI0018C9F032|nr:DUF3800 domain-containing protein [Streptococcus sp. NLN64]MBG9368277.1 DUF3800 domain-containing protein [Streptococcus sp. NLN64]
MNYYLDESGSITTSNSQHNRFFIIAGVSTQNPKKVKRVFRKAKLNYLKHNPDLELDVKTEIKGSEMPLDFKDYVFTQLIEKTDITFNFLVFDNHNVQDHLRQKPNITFNYLMYLKTNNLITSYEPVRLDLDERNKSVKSLKALEEYLQTRLCVEDNKTPDIRVEFFDSATHTMIQIADILANHLHRIFKQVARGHNYSNNAQLLHKLHVNNVQHCQYFPWGHCQCKDLFS